jgi:hypothetical protein
MVGVMAGSVCCSVLQGTVCPGVTKIDYPCVCVCVCVGVYVCCSVLQGTVCPGVTTVIRVCVRCSRECECVCVCE